MSFEKTESPSRARLEQLRTKGLAPISEFTVRAAILLVVFIISWLSKQTIFSGIQILFDNVSTDSGSVNLNDTLTVIKPIFWIFVKLSTGIIIGGFILAALQTGFIFKINKLNFDFSRILPFVGEGAKVRRVKILTKLVNLLGIFLAAVLLGVYAGPVFLKMLILPPLEYAREFLSVISKSLPLLAGTIVFAAAFGFFIAKNNFLRANRMTRAEIKNEGVS